jgi:cytochrome c-type biogenesis protein CcmH
MTAPEAVRRTRLPARLTSWTGIAGLVALTVMVTGLVALIVVGVRGEAPPTTLAAKAHQIAATLRCPICEDLSVADSPAPLAGQMRQQINQQLAAGKTAEQIRQNFVASYGDSVLLSPPHQGIGQIAYLLPILVLAAGLTAAVLLLRNWRKPAPAAARGSPAARRTDLTVADRNRLDEALARLREEEP